MNHGGLKFGKFWVTSLLSEEWSASAPPSAAREWSTRDKAAVSWKLFLMTFFFALFLCLSKEIALKLWIVICLLKLITAVKKI